MPVREILSPQPDGRDEPSAIQHLLDAARRYSEITKSADLDFRVPETSALFTVKARLKGNVTTDFGAPDILLANDWDRVEEDEMGRFVKLLNACWLAFDKAVEKAEGKELKKGPRGGGRDLSKMMDHVVGAEEGYLKTLGWKFRLIETEARDERKNRVRSEILRGLQAAVEGKLPRKGPRGGKRWPPRFFVRRVAWHAVDHAWELEDRIIP